MKKLIPVLPALLISALLYGQVTEGLVGHFSFNNGSFEDLAGYNDLVLSANGDSTYFLTNDRFGNPDYAIDFQGAVLSGGITSRDITNEVTVSLWMNTDNSPEESKFIINKYYCDEPPQGYLLAVNGDSVTFDGRDNTALGYMRSGWSKTPINDGEWHHIVGLARAEGTWEIWVDAHKDTSNTYSSLSGLNHNFCSLGIAGPDYINEDRIYIGILDDIRIYNRALNSMEIDSLYNEENPTTGLSEFATSPSYFKLYPTPVIKQITIELSTIMQKNTSLTLYNLNGQQIITQPITKPKTDIDVSQLPGGIYILKVWNDKEVMVQRVIKQ